MAASLENPADERLSRSVKDALRQCEPIRAVDLGHIQVEARAGVVLLGGIVASEPHRILAADLVRRVPGVKEIVNRLVSDEELERRIARELYSDRTTRGQRIAVNVVGGVASLYGAVPTAEAAETIARVALAVEGVLAVENRVKVIPPGSPAILAWQLSRVMSDQ